jgi:hypothetical protein
VLAGLGLGAAPSLAAEIPDSIKTSVDASKQRDTIQAFIREKISALIGPDPVARSAARESLIDNAAIDKSNTSVAYKDVYAEELDNELVKAIKGASMEGRLNAAIVAARVARGDRGAQLADTAIAAISDESEPVMLWGVKIAAQLMPAALSVSKTPPVLTKITTVAAGEPPARVIPEIYDVLTLTSYSSDPQAIRSVIPDAQWRTLVPLISPELFKFWRARLSGIAAGSNVEPAAEVIPPKFVGVLRTWSAMPPAQQVEAMQLLVDQLSLAAERFSSAAGAERDAFLQVLKSTGSALEVIGGGSLERSPALEGAARAVRNLGPNSTGAAVDNAVLQAISAVKAIPKFSQLKPAPSVAPPSTRPA